ncbi:hypothetical protein AMJ80_12265 [bacterium SM23_31]|nr:MAG: hypothetical protein AMJ80_12265 [bacterium SM23_31]
MKMFRILVIVLLLFFNCSKDVDVQTFEMEPPLTDVLTFELSFGDENTIDKDEFLLARPRSRRIVVNQNEDIYVYDEYKIKVYDKNGNPKTIFGRMGNGPGEFRGIVRPLKISPEGILSVYDRGFPSYISLFSPEHKLIAKRSIENNEIFKSIRDSYKLERDPELYALGENEFILMGNDVQEENNPQDDVYYEYLFHLNQGDVNLITKQRNVFTFISIIGNAFSRGGTGFTGRLNYTILPNRRLLYSHAAHDASVENGIGTAVLHIVSLDTGEMNDIQFTYEPREITDSEIEIYDYMGESKSVIMQHNSEILARKIKSALQEAGYHAPFHSIISDRNFVFLIYNKLFLKDNQFLRNGYLIYCIDTIKQKQVSSFLLEELPDFIYNGYLYNIGESTEGFAVIEKYKIDPAVYGK